MNTNSDVVLEVSDFVALVNQTLDFAYPSVTILGELANFRVSKNRWVYFDLKDDNSSVRFFGTVYMLPGPLEDGMMMRVTGSPRLHPLYGFSVNVQTMQPAGEGSIKRAAELLQAKLTAEGLFDPERKRPLPYPPQRVGLITSAQSAAYADFIKNLGARWGGVDIELIDVQVQGDAAPEQIIRALERFNQQAAPPDVLVLIRGGGSADDLAAFSTESVTRAVAASRIPTLVAIGHEVDVSLAELAADHRASTPSNAAESLVPDKRVALQNLAGYRLQLNGLITGHIASQRASLQETAKTLTQLVEQRLQSQQDRLKQQRQLLRVLDPSAVLKRGYAVVRQDGKAVRSRKAIKAGELNIQLADGNIDTTVILK
jgi:exodeoxyribonuclease VII large subunit